MDRQIVSKHISDDAMKMLEQAKHDAAVGKSGRVFGDDYPRLGTKPKVRAVVEPEPVVIEAAPSEPAPLSQSEREELEALRKDRKENPEPREPLQLLPGEDEKLSDYGEVGEPSSIITKEEVDGLLGMTEAEAAAAVQAMKAERRRKFTELLFAELSELKNMHGMAGEDLKREASIQSLIGLFARLGEV